MQLIEHLDELIVDQDPNALAQDRLTSTFVRASTCIDASVKIYCGRVDATHQNAFRVLSGLSSNKEEIVEEAEDAKPEDANENGEETEKKKKRTYVSTVDTIVSNVSDINAKVCSCMMVVVVMAEHRSGIRS